MMGIKLVRIPRCVRSDHSDLRLLRLQDLPTLTRLFRERAPAGSRATVAVPRNVWSFRQWLCRTFPVFYLIESKNGDKTAIRGFVGLYNIKLGETLWLSMEIFDPNDRGRHLGSSALQTLLACLEKCGAAINFQAQVAPSNLASIHLFDNLGFDICERSEEALIMKKSIAPRSKRT